MTRPSYFLLFLFISALACCVSGGELILNQEVQALLEATKASGATFVRNGKDHTADEAVEHMEKKYAHFKKKGKIKTSEDFIRLAGTKSLMSGTEYTLRLPDGREEKSGVWLTARLAEIRASEAYKE